MKLHAAAMQDGNALCTSSDTAGIGRCSCLSMAVLTQAQWLRSVVAFIDLQVGMRVSTRATQQARASGQVYGCDAQFDTPYGRKAMVYADYAASGRLLRPVEEWLQRDVYPWFANVHSEVRFCDMLAALADSHLHALALLTAICMRCSGKGCRSRLYAVKALVQ